MGKTLVVALVVLSLVGCTSLQPLPDASPATLQGSLKRGDSVEVERVNGTKQPLKFEEVAGDMLVGVHAGQRYRIPLANIRTVTVSTMSVGWTVAIVAAAVAVVVAVSGGGGGGGGSGGGGGY